MFKDKQLANLFRATAIVFSVALVQPAAMAAEDNTILIGAPLPLTGPLAPDGGEQRKGYVFWQDFVNKRGGIKVGDKNMKVKVIFSDYESKTPRAVRATERLITQDKVNFLFAPFGSGAAKATSTISERYKIPMIAATASSEQVYDQGYKYLFGVFTPNKTLTNPIADLIKKDMGDKKIKVAILARDDLFPLQIAEEAQKSAEARGMEVVAFEKYSIGTVDHVASLSKLASHNPDWLFFSGYINDAIQAKQQLYENNIHIPYVSLITGPSYQQYIDSLPNAASNNSITADWWTSALKYSGEPKFGSTEDFVRLYKEKQGEIPTYIAAASAASGLIYEYAIERAGSLDGEKVRNEIAKMDLKTFYGDIRFNDVGQITTLQPPITQVQDGKRVVIYPQAAKQGELRRAPTK